MTTKTPTAQVLDAVATFLSQEVMPRVEDKALAFRVLMAVGLIQGAAVDHETLEQRTRAQLERLQLLLPQVLPLDSQHLGTAAAQQDALHKLNTALAGQIRACSLTDAQKKAAWEHVRQTCVETLGACNPRFDVHAVVK